MREQRAHELASPPLLLVVGVGGGVLRVGVVAEQEGDGELGELRVDLAWSSAFQHASRVKKRNDELARVWHWHDSVSRSVWKSSQLAPPAHLARAVARVAAAAVAVKVGPEGSIHGISS